MRQGHVQLAPDQLKFPTLAQVNASLANQLYKTVDGRGFQNTRAVYVAHSWMGSDSMTLTGAQGVKNIQLQENSIQGRANYVSTVTCPELHHNYSKRVQGINSHAL